VRSPLIIVGEVLLEVAAQPAFVPHDDVVEALAPNRSYLSRGTQFSPVVGIENSPPRGNGDAVARRRH
jgi:hypothetical protein